MASSSKMPPRGRDFWGPPYWELIHTFARCYMPNNRDTFLRFLILLTQTLPCMMCRKNLVSKLKNVSPKEYLNSPDQLFLYTYILHDMANKHISDHNPDKKKVSPPFKLVFEMYRRKCDELAKVNMVIWHVIHIFATTLKYEHGEHFPEFLEVISKLMPDKKMGEKILAFLKLHPIGPYLRNNHDAFMYSYMLHDYASKNTNKTFNETKTFYFTSLKEECDECKL